MYLYLLFPSSFSILPFCLLHLICFSPLFLFQIVVEWLISPLPPPSLPPPGSRLSRAIPGQGGAVLPQEHQEALPVYPLQWPARVCSWWQSSEQGPAATTSGGSLGRRLGGPWPSDQYVYIHVHVNMQGFIYRGDRGEASPNHLTLPLHPKNKCRISSLWHNTFYFVCFNWRIPKYSNNLHSIPTWNSAWTPQLKWTIEKTLTAVGFDLSCV